MDRYVGLDADSTSCTFAVMLALVLKRGFLAGEGTVRTVTKLIGRDRFWPRQARPATTVPHTPLQGNHDPSRDIVDDQVPISFPPCINALRRLRRR